MKTSILLLLFTLLSSCSNAEKANINRLIIGDYEVEVFPGNLETEQSCPQFKLFKAQEDTPLQTLEACTVKLAGFRTFDARKDFAFIEFSNFQIKEESIAYNADMTVLQGPEVQASCYVVLKKGILEQTECVELEE